MQAHHHGIALAALAIAGRPETAEEDLAGALPKEHVLEGGKVLRRIELFPGAGIDLAADAVDVENDFGVVQTVGFEAEILDVIVPAGVFAESGQADKTA